VSETCLPIRAITIIRLREVRTLGENREEELLGKKSGKSERKRSNFARELSMLAQPLAALHRVQAWAMTLLS
jgi:hypothetical protein